jgi:predicted PhzF superfamily epimerase YddE/YHI9
MMQFDKQTVVDLIQQQMGSQHAEQAAQQLPDQVDHEQHADLLQKFGVNPQDLLTKFLK